MAWFHHRRAYRITAAKVIICLGKFGSRQRFSRRFAGAPISKANSMILMPLLKPSKNE
jgi:hypothetical protein